MQSISSVNLSHDPVHHYIPFVGTSADVPTAHGGEVTEREIIDHPWLQRLRHIHQLQTAWYVYPAAEHTRFQHVIGTMHLASMAVSRLYDSLKTICPDAPTQPYVESLLRMSGLLHDVGHGPFGHFFDTHFLSHFGLNHETLGTVIIRQELGELLRRIRRTPHGTLAENEQLDPDQIAWLITRPVDGEAQDQPKWLSFLRSLLSGIYTIDNMDFVLRDAYMTGYSQRAADVDRLLHYSFFSPSGLTMHDRGIDALIQFMTVRGELFRTVYFHRTVRAIDLTLADLFAESKDYLFDGNPLDALDQYRDLTEWSLLVDVRRWRHSKDKRRRELGRKWELLFQRNIPWRMVCQRNLVFGEQDAERGSIFSDSELVERKLRGLLSSELKDQALRVDIARHIHRPHTRGPAPNQNFLYDSAHDKVRPLTDNQLFRRLPTSHRICRVYAQSLSHRAEIAAALDSLIQPSGVDDLTNM